MVANVEYEVAVRDVEYAQVDGQALLARIYQPQGTGPFPSLVDVHGGAWNSGDRKNNEGIDRALAARGVVVAALDFRQPPVAGYPASIADVNLGIRWLKANAPELKATSSVGVLGNSSGGHQAVLSGVRPRDPRYAATPLTDHPEIDAQLDYVIAAWPVIDPLYRFRFAQQNNRAELVKAHLAYWGSEEAMAEGAPRNALEQGEAQEMPPSLMLLKENDTNHPQAMQDAFVAAYRQRGGSIEVHTFNDLPEGRLNPSPAEPASQRALELMLDFIERHTR
jgi:acetyl esterase/lipase